MPSRSPRRLIATAVVAVATALLLAAPARAQEDLPVLSNPSVSPSSLPYEGGTVVVAVDATDDDGIAAVYAEFAHAYLGSFGIELAPVSGNRYSGSTTLPANYTDEPANWNVTFSAIDTEGTPTIESLGDVTVEPQPQFDEFPSAFDPSVAPRSLPAAGGLVALGISGSDDRSVATARAVITAPDGTATEVVLDPTSFSRFEGTFAVPANAGAAPLQYAVQFVVEDDIGQSDPEDGGVVTVAGIPAGGPLTLSAASLDFGAVRTGRQVVRRFVLRNTGRRGSPAVAGTIVAPAAPFAVRGGGRTFCLRPGQRRTVVVTFRPAAAGPFTAVVAIQRADGGQPGLAVALRGSGVGAPKQPRGAATAGAARAPAACW